MSIPARCTRRCSTGTIGRTSTRIRTSFSSTGSATTTIPIVSFGQPIPTPGPAVTGSIGIRLDFNLTALDRATFTSNHVVNEVPEPQTGALVALGLALLAKRRRH